MEQQILSVQQSDHDVRADSAGASTRSRLTCFSPECRGTTIVHQPYMQGKAWEEAQERFLEQHPCLVVKGDGWGG